LYDYARKRGYTNWTPLVSLEAFEQSLDKAIETLGHDAFNEGCYLEFGVSRGTSMLGAHNAFERAGVSPRMIGFDSFRGMPVGAENEGWKTGQYASTLGATKKYLRSNGADTQRIKLVKGWFDDTLTDETRSSLKISNATILMVDCDIYSASKLALDFCFPVLARRAVIIFDDWGPMERLGAKGQKEAYAEFLAEHPSLKSTPLGSYDLNGKENGRVFLVEIKEQ
jgi:hypothetical protein